jgi:SAM-dependent methyltransferase
MNDHVRAFIAIASRTFRCDGTIYQLGMRGVGDESVRNLFPGRTFVGIGERGGLGIDRVEDSTNMTIADNSATAVLALECLEATFDVVRTMDEVLRVLRPGGLFFAATRLDGERSSRTNDYWRLTPNCLTRIMTAYDAWLIGWQGPADRPHTVYSIGAKHPASDQFSTECERFMRGFDGWIAADARTQPWSRRMLARLRHRWPINRRAAPASGVQFVVHLPDSSDWKRHLLSNVPRTRSA